MWDGEYWLPFSQEVELRRELPIIEFLGGSVIRSRFEIRNYQFNPELPESLFRGADIISVPGPQRRNFPFESGLYDQLAEQGLDSSPEIETIREEATALMRQRYLTGLRRSRLHVPSVSSAYRYNRAEGSYLGAGTSVRLGGNWTLISSGGYAFGRENGQLAVDLRSSPGPKGFNLGAWWNEFENASGRLPGASGAINTLGGLVANEDYTDPYFTSGAGVGYVWGRGEASSRSVRVVWERHRSGTNVVDDRVATDLATESGTGRPVLAVDEGDDRAVEATIATRTPAGGFRTSATARVGQMEDQPYVSIWWATTLRRERRESGGALEARFRVGASTEDAPIQTFFLLGGRHTLPGYPHRSFIGNRMALFRVEASQAVLAPWLTIRAFGTAGATGFARNGTPDPGWLRQSTDGVKSAAGMGIDLGWDLFHFDLGRGLNDGGNWEFVFSVQRRFWEWL